MTNPLDVIAAELETAGHGVGGQSIFVQHQPAANYEGILLREDGGPIDADIPNLKRSVFQIVTRSEDYNTARQLAVAVSQTLTLRQKALGSAWFYECNPRHQPIPFGRDTSGIETFVVNFDATWREN